MRALLLGLLLSAPALAGEPADLVVVIAVDGLGWDHLERARPWLDGGLARLLAEGSVEAAASYDHLNAETGPGHASLATGAPPSVHGVVGNRWFVDDSHGGLRPRYCVEAEPGAPGPTAATLAVGTFADALVAAHPDARVVTLSGKDRAALLLAGRDPRHVPSWYDKKTGTFVGSPAYAATEGWQQAARAAIDAWNRDEAGPGIRPRYGATWSPTEAPTGSEGFPQPARALTRWQTADLGLGWDHDLGRHPRGYYEAVYASPIVDALTGALAVTLLRSDAVGLGRGGAPDVLGLSFSAHDTVSHPYGSESEEELDTLRRLDHVLADVLAALDGLRAEGVDVVVALSADHGFAPLPEVVRRDTRTRVGGRLPWVDESWADDPGRADAFWSSPRPTPVERLERGVRDALCLSENVDVLHGMEGWALAYAPWPAPVRTLGGRGCRRSVTHADVDRVLPAVVDAQLHEEIEDVLLASRAARWPDTDAARRARHATFPGRSGDAFLIPRPYVIVAYDPARGATHGSHHAYDQHVPLIFWGPGFPARVVTTPSSPYDLAPTVAGVLGVALPTSTGRDLRPRDVTAP